jgi:hypothetical protein
MKEEPKHKVIPAQVPLGEEEYDPKLPPEMKQFMTPEWDKVFIDAVAKAKELKAKKD